MVFLKVIAVGGLYWLFNEEAKTLNSFDSTKEIGRELKTINFAKLLFIFCLRKSPNFGS